MTQWWTSSSALQNALTTSAICPGARHTGKLCWDGTQTRCQPGERRAPELGTCCSVKKGKKSLHLSVAFQWEAKYYTQVCRCVMNAILAISFWLQYVFSQSQFVAHLTWHHVRLCVCVSCHLHIFKQDMYIWMGSDCMRHSNMPACNMNLVYCIRSTSVCSVCMTQWCHCLVNGCLDFVMIWTWLPWFGHGCHDLDMVAMIGTRDQLCWLAESCKIVFFFYRLVSIQNTAHRESALQRVHHILDSIHNEWALHMQQSWHGVTLLRCRQPDYLCGSAAHTITRYTTKKKTFTPWPAIYGACFVQQPKHHSVNSTVCRRFQGLPIGLQAICNWMAPAATGIYTTIVSLCYHNYTIVLSQLHHCHINLDFQVHVPFDFTLVQLVSWWSSCLCIDNCP